MGLEFIENLVLVGRKGIVYWRGLIEIMSGNNFSGILRNGKAKTVRNGTSKKALNFGKTGRSKRFLKSQRTH